MSQTFTRPFRPIELTPTSLESFPVETLARELMTEETFQHSGRSALTLTHHKDFTVVLTVMKANTQLKDHQASGPVLLQPLFGRMTVTKSAGSDPLPFQNGTSIFFGSHLVHNVEAHEDSAFLIIIGGQE